MPPSETSPVAITPQGVRDGEPAVLAELARRRGPAVIALATEICQPAYVVRAAADGFARFRAEVAGPAAPDAHPDALLLRAARRAALDLAPRGPDLGCAPALELLSERAERAIATPQSGMLERHLAGCEHCRDLAEGLVAGEEAYRDAPETPLDAAQLAPIVAAMAAAAPVRTSTSRPAVSAAPDPGPALHLVPEAEEAGPPQALPALTAVQDPADEASAPEDAPPVPPPADDAEEEDGDEPPDRPAPPVFRSSYYELPPLPPRERAARTKKAARQARRAARGAAALSRRAGTAARERLDRPSQDDGPEVSEAAAAPTQTTATWQRVDEIEFPARLPLPALGTPASSAVRSRRGRGLPSLRPREVALPIGLLIVAVLVVLAVAGVFSGKDPAGSGASAPEPALTAAAQSATSVSLTDAARLATAPASTP